MSVKLGHYIYAVYARNQILIFILLVCVCGIGVIFIHQPSVVDNSDKKTDTEKINSHSKTDRDDFQTQIPPKKRDQSIGVNNYNVNGSSSQTLKNTTLSQISLGRPNSVKKVLLYTYYRGGSTFLGDIFNNHPDVFYWFEPLAGITDSWGPAIWPINEKFTREWYFYRNKTMKPVTQERRHSLTSAAKNIFDCDFQNLPLGLLKHRFMVSQVWDKSMKMRGYKSCANRATVKKCLPILIDQCKKSRIRVIKTIRLRMDLLEDIIITVPGIKVIHQLRDPRGLMNSWWKLFHSNNKLEAEMDSKLTCHWLLYDIHKRQQLERLYPNTFFVNKYEDMAACPMSTSTNIYLFLRESLPEKIYEWIWLNTHSAKDNGDIGTARKNSALTATSWKNSLPAAFLKFTNFHCRETILDAGYFVADK